MPQLARTENTFLAWQEAIWLLIGLVTPLFVNFWAEQQFEASKVWLLRTFVGVLVLFWLASRLNGKHGKTLPLLIRNTSIAFVLILLLATAFSTNCYIAIFGTLDRANGLLTQLSYLALFLCIATQIDSYGSRRLIQAIILTSLPICVLGFAQWSGWQPIAVYTDARSPLTTTLGRSNFTGAYLALVLPLTLVAAQMATNRWSRAGYGMLIVMEVVIILLTQARAAWIAAVVGIILLLWLRSAPRHPQRVRCVSVLGGVTLLAAALLIIGQHGIAAGGSIAARWTIWQSSLRLLWPRLWLGYGADTLELHFPSVYPPQLVYYQGRGIVVDRAHNWLLDWSLNYGVVATILLTGLVLLILWQGWQQLMMADSACTPSANERLGIDEHLEPDWLAACMAVACTQMVGNLFLFDVAATASVFWMLLGIIVASTNPNNRITESRYLPPWVRKGVMVGGVCVIGWFAWESSIRPLVADIHSRRGALALSQSDPAAALAEYSAAAAYQPHRADYHVAVALTSAQVGNLSQAEESQHRAITLRPTDPVLYTQLAKIYAYGAINSPEKMARAYAAYDQAIGLAPTIGLTYRQFADLALRSGDEANALRLAQLAVNLDVTDGMAFGILGWTQLDQRNLAAAQNAFEQAVKWQPDSADFHLGLATVHFRLGNYIKAHQSVEKSLQLDPAYEPSLTLEVQLQEN